MVSAAPDVPARWDCFRFAIAGDMLVTELVEITGPDHCLKATRDGLVIVPTPEGKH